MNLHVVCHFVHSGTKRQSLQISLGGSLVNLQLSLLWKDNVVQILFRELEVAVV